MPEFLQLLPPSDALASLIASIRVRLGTEVVDTVNALDRVTATSVIAPHPLPAFPRSTVDGFAVQAADTYGASDSLPAYLTLAGEVPMGAPPHFAIVASQCALIHTGGMLPQGSNAVVMVEHTQAVSNEGEVQTSRLPDIEILRPVAISENVLKVGEDVSQGDEVLPAGLRLRPADIGSLMAFGLTQVQVVRRPRAGILSSGDEIVPPQVEPSPGQVRDVNAYSLAALVQEAGGVPVHYGIIPDREEALFAAGLVALAECDLVVITAGSSASTHDLTAQVINRLGSPGVLVHGVNVRPGKPTILAICNGKAVIGLPGNPVSALVIAGLFVIPVISALLGLRREPQPSIQARLTLNLPSQAGREDWVAVRLVESPSGYLAEPIFGKSNLIVSLSRAQGLVRIPPDANGLEVGSLVQVVLL